MLSIRFGLPESTANMTELARPSRVEITSPTRLLDTFYKVNEYTVSYEQFNGEMSVHRSVLVFERGDAVAAFLYDPERRVVITVNQFRLPTREKGHGQGWLIEAVTGMIQTDAEGRPYETPLQCLMREVREETGYKLTHATPVTRFFSSPGASTELIHLFYAEVRGIDKTAAGGGVAEDGEDIAVVEHPLEDFLRRLTAGEFEDPKLIIAGQWFMARRASIRAEWDDNHSRTFITKINERQILGIKTGNIRATKDVEVWVNSENTDMMMDRYFGRSVSATIRSLGAKKLEDGRSIAEDTIGKALAAQMRNRSFVKPGTVIRTTAGELQRTHNVRQIFHVASVAGNAGMGFSTSLANFELSIDNVLKAISAERRYRSALVPIFGTGQGGYLVDQVAPLLVKRALAFFRENPKSPLREIYFLAYSEGDLDILRNAIFNFLSVNPVEEREGIV
jgi:ADP-ribose pyrophosphatase